jgi:hypothetical protein
MSAVSRVRWYDLVNLIVGLWVLVSPWVVSETAEAHIASSKHIAGALTVLLAGYALVRSVEVAEYGLIAVGLWLIASPWILGFDATVMRQAIFYGVIIVTCAGFAIQHGRKLKVAKA